MLQKYYNYIKRWLHLTKTIDFIQKKLDTRYSRRHEWEI
mgnify:CR=1 FL=1